tara:strand:- start:476 stop:1231 length:756 start_codon:yes stop_codon:yes gene_type:complete
MTFDQVVEAHQTFLDAAGSDEDAQQRVLNFLEWEEPDEDLFAQDVRIVLASAEFSKELTSSVLWLNEKGLDIRCVKLEPFSDGERTFLDIQQVIPLPETEQFQVQVRKKKQKELLSRVSTTRDYSKFTLRFGEKCFSGLNKRNLMFHLVYELIESGIKPEELSELIHWRRNNLFVSFEGALDEVDFSEKLMEFDSGGKLPKTKRFFCKPGELFEVGDKTYAMTNQWGQRTLEAVDLVIEKYPDLRINVERE